MFTVGQLKRWIEDFDLSDDAKILYQRIEDAYYTDHGWKVVAKPTEDGLSEYVEVHSPVKYPDDGNLYLDAHY